MAVRRSVRTNRPQIDAHRVVVDREVEIFDKYSLASINVNPISIRLELVWRRRESLEALHMDVIAPTKVQVPKRGIFGSKTLDADARYIGEEEVVWACVTVAWGCAPVHTA